MLLKIVKYIVIFMDLCLTNLMSPQACLGDVKFSSGASFPQETRSIRIALPRVSALAV